MSGINLIETEILVIGGGAAGMAAASAAAVGGLDVLLCDERDRPGGILPQCIHSGFGSGRFGAEMTGPEYCERESEAFLASGAAYLPETRVLSLNSDRTAVISGPQGLQKVSFRECILAAGCREKPLWSLPVAGTRPEGIFTAGEAQEMTNLGHMDIGDDVFILGSGDIGMIMARRFALLGKNVIGIAECRDRLGGLRRNQQECIEAYGIPVYLRSTVTEVHGYPRIGSVTLHHLDSGADEVIACSTLITSLGLVPEQSLAEPLMTGGRLPGWLHMCGNAEKVHEIADSVSAEGERLGKELAEKKSGVTRSGD